MSQKTVDFHPLERLDLVDVEALQAQVLTYLDQTIGNVLGGDSSERCEGILKQPASTTVVNVDAVPYRINFGDFIMLTNVADSPVTRSRKSQVVVFDASASYHGACDFSTARTLVQNYVNALQNPALPPKPTDPFPTYGENIDGQYYPYVWARAASVDLETGNRRFWSVANGFEVTQNVTTRSGYGLEFLVQYTTPTLQQGTGWSKIARIEEWTLNGSDVELNASGIKFIYLADNLLPRPDKPNGSPAFYSEEVLYNESDFGGVLGAMRILNTELSRLRTTGTYDSDWGISSSYGSVFPLISLDGAYDAIETLDARTRSRDVHVSSIIAIDFNTTSNTYTASINHISVPQGLSRTYIQPTVAVDFRLYDLIGRSFPFDIASNTVSTASEKIDAEAALSLFRLGFDQIYNDYHISGSIQPITSVLDDVTSRTHDWGIHGGVSDQINSTNGLLKAYPNVWWISDLASGTTPEIHKITELTAKDSAGNDVTFYGLRFGLGGITPWINSIYTNQGLRFRFKVDLTLSKNVE